MFFLLEDQAPILLLYMTDQVLFHTVSPNDDDAVWIGVLAFDRETLIGPMGKL